MTNENKIEVTEKKCDCFLCSEWFKKFLVKALAVFVGTFSALSLFAALHKPPMIKPVPYGPGMMRPCQCKMHHFHGHRGPRADFHKKFEKRDFQKFEQKDFGQKPEANR